MTKKDQNSQNDKNGQNDKNDQKVQKWSKLPIPFLLRSLTPE